MFEMLTFAIFAGEATIGVTIIIVVILKAHSIIQEIMN